MAPSRGIPKKRRGFNTALLYDCRPPGGVPMLAREVFRGEAEEGDIEKIKNGLIDDQVFIPLVVGVPPIREGLGRTAHRFLGLEKTTDKSTDPRKIKEIVTALSTMKEDLPGFAEATRPKPRYISRG